MTTIRLLVSILIGITLMLTAHETYAQDCPPVVVEEACQRNLRALQVANRKLDQSAGRLQQEREAHADTRKELAQAHESIGRLKAEREAMWSPWVWVGAGAGGALATVLLVVLIAR